MNKHIKKYLDSFKVKKEYWYTLLVDAGFLGAMVLIFSFFKSVIEKKAYWVTGKTPEQVQQMLLNSPEQAEAFLSLMKVSVIGIVVVIVGGLLLYSLSRKLIWNYLSGKKFSKKKYWKWNSLNLVLIVPLFGYFLVFGLARLILGYVFSLFGNQAVLDLFYNLANMFFLFMLVVFVFLVYYNFNKEYKVWESMGKSFNLVKSKWKDVWPMFLFILGTAVVLSLVFWPAGKLFAYQLNVLMGINLAVSLLFLAWMRIYVLRTVKE